MTYKTYNCHSYNIYTIKTDKFKTCHMEIIYRKDIVKEELAKDALLVDVLCENSKKYPQHKDVVKRLEELYKTAFWSISGRTGNTAYLNYVINFISPEYINEENYLEEVLSFPFEIILHPNVENDEFDEKTFKLCQKRNIIDVKSVEEDGFRLSVNKTLETLGTPTSYQRQGTIEEIEEITPSSLYKHYKKTFKESSCDIFIIGNLDMDKVVKLIKKYFPRRVINNKRIDTYVNNETRKKVLELKETGNFMQANLVVLYNLLDLNDYEKNIVFNIYNYILGSGGITSKLYQEIREKNSYCYAINSMYLKYDNLLAIHVSLENKNCKNAVRLIKKVIKNMAHGKISEEEIKEAKQNYELSLAMSLDNNVSILNNYVFKTYADLPEIEERLKLIRKVSYEDVVKVAQKLKINTIFTLKGDNKNE